MRLDIHTRPQMASHNLSWVPGAHVRFGDLDFIATMEGELVQMPIVIRPFLSTSVDTITKMLEEL